MSDQALTKLLAAAPLAAGGLLVLLSPIYDRIIESGAERDFTNHNYLNEGEKHTPVSLITRYASWALDVAQSGPLIFGPVIGLIVALSGSIKGSIIWIDFIFIFVGFAIFGYTIVVRHPVMYGAKKYGFKHDGKLWPAWTRVSIAAIILYLGAAAAALVLA